MSPGSGIWERLHASLGVANDPVIVWIAIRIAAKSTGALTEFLGNLYLHKAPSIPLHLDAVFNREILSREGLFHYH
jgi:hypothetical protein